MNTRNTKKNNNKILLFVAFIFAFVFLLSAAFLIIDSLGKRQDDGFDGDYNASDSTLVYNNQEYVLKDNLETALIIGVDKFEDFDAVESYNNDKCADFILLFVIDDDNKTYSCIQINRDAVTDVNILGVAGDTVDTEKMQIALAHTYGNGGQVSCRNTADAASKLLLNTKIDRYLSLTMEAVPVLTDTVGGVEVEILDDFSGIDDTLTMGDVVNLKGEHALNYVRSRYGLENSSNDNRMARQRQFMKSLIEKINYMSDRDDDFIFRLATNLSEYTVSNYSVNQLQNRYNKISDYEFGGIYTIEGEYAEGEKFMEFYPDEDSLKKLVVDLFYQKINTD